MNLRLLFVTLMLFSSFYSGTAQHSIARDWNELLLEAIRNDLARPTVHARNLFHTSAAMYDAWSVFDEEAQPFLLGKTVNGFSCAFDDFPMPTDVEAARKEAISYAAYRLLRHRFQNSPGAGTMIPQFNQEFFELGYVQAYTSTNYASGNPADLGNYIAQCYINFGLQDNANEQANYNNQSYQPSNSPLVTNFPGNPNLTDPNSWQPLTLDIFIDQSGNPFPFNTPQFLGPEWGNVTPFALSNDDLTIYERNGFDYWVYHDPGPPPMLDTTQITESSQQYQWGNALVASWSGQMSSDLEAMVDVSPASYGNLPSMPTDFADFPDFYNLLEGGDPSQGHDLNPVTGQPYEPQMVPLGDYTRVLAEFWADGPESETPPGHWFTILNYVNDHPQFEKRYRGEGPILDDLEWDIKTYFALGGTMHDAAITAWGCKGWYDYIRPISAIRYMADLGQSADPNLPNYHVGGMPLIPGHIELVTTEDPLYLADTLNLNKVKVYAWRGPDYINNTAIDYAGVDWILAENWWPYQRPTFVTPNFAGYVSGHSTFSRAAAELMTAITGDEFFPGGMAEFNAPQNQFLVFEEGPSVDVTLQWATYRDASDQTSLSRIWGGIHPPADDIPGRFMGIEVGTDAFAAAETYFFKDEDNDGFLSNVDCDDNNADINPAAAEICDGIDNNCDGNIDEGLELFTYYLDADGDSYGDAAMTADTCILVPPTGYVTNDLDCDDTNNAIHPDAIEICDDIDNDCNGLIDDAIPYYTYYLDSDSDGFGDAANAIDICLATPPANYVTNDLDCDDLNPAIHPDATEICDDIDNDCNGAIDDNIPYYTYYQDSDADGFGNAAESTETCFSTPPTGYVTNDQDCDDTATAIHPDATEICDGIDNDCNGEIDDAIPYYTYYIDADNDNFGNVADSIVVCEDTPPTGYVVDATDCNDDDNRTYPNAVETADNGIDEDCSGLDLYLEMKLFPNPTTDELTIHLPMEGNFVLRITSADGRRTWEERSVFTSNFTTTGVKNLPQGVYFLEVFNVEEERLFMDKFVKND